MLPMNGWENFYVIVGSSAGALIGLQFVVMTLIAGRSVARAEALAGDAFSTPSVVHFGVVLLLSAVISAPWEGINSVAAIWGGVGFIGIIYVAIVARRMRAQTVYKPVFEDWLFHVLLPLAAYAMMTGSAFVAHSRAHTALFIVGAAALLLLFIGIHNAWDTVMHLVFVERQGKREGKRKR
jgi:hypothetical protein